MPLIGSSIASSFLSKADTAIVGIVLVILSLTYSFYCHQVTKTVKIFPKIFDIGSFPQ